MRQAVLVGVLAALPYCESASDRVDATPVVSSGNSSSRATLVVCGPSCDGVGMFSEAREVLVADGKSDIVVRVPSPYRVSASWTLAGFERRDEQTLVAPAPPPGCHRTGVIVTGVNEFDWKFEVVILGDSDSVCE